MAWTVKGRWKYPPFTPILIDRNSGTIGRMLAQKLVSQNLGTWFLSVSPHVLSLWIFFFFWLLLGLLPRPIWLHASSFFCILFSSCRLSLRRVFLAYLFLGSAIIHVFQLEQVSNGPAKRRKPPVWGGFEWILLGTLMMCSRPANTLALSLSYRDTLNSMAWTMNGSWRISTIYTIYDRDCDGWGWHLWFSRLGIAHYASSSLLSWFTSQLCSSAGAGVEWSSAT